MSHQESIALEETLRRLEEAILVGPLRHDRQWLESILAENFYEFGASGHIWSREAILAHLASELPATGHTLANFRLMRLADDTALVTYTVISDQATRNSLRSSIWQHSNGRWQILFHQGTITADS